MGSPQKPGKPEQPGKRPFDQFVKYSNLGIQMLVIIGLGAWGGHMLDQRLDTTKPWWTMGLSLLGAIVAIIYTIREVTRDNS